jgi:putative flippase GtrA
MLPGAISGLWRLSSVFMEIALHRRGPEDLPASRFLFGLLAIVYGCTSFIATQIVEPWPRAAAMVAADVGTYLAFLWVLLALFGRRPRYLQTASALLGSGTVLTLFGIPLILLAGFANGEVETGNLGTWLFFLLIVWSIDVASFVLSRALPVPYIVALMIVLGYTFGSASLGRLLFPVAS